MMWVFKIFILRMKSCIRKPYVWAFLVVAILAALIPALSSQYESPGKLPIGLVNEDAGTLSGKLVQRMSDYDSNLMIDLMNRETALRYLAMGRLEAVYIINKGFTQHIQKGEYEDLITMVTAPASSAADALSETVINSTLVVWIEEKAMLEMDAFLKQQGLPFTDKEKQAMRTEFDGILSHGSQVTVDDHIPKPPKTVGAYAALLSSSAWYAAFVACFIIVSAGWVIDSRRKALGERMQSAGMRPLSALSGSVLTIIAFSLLGWLAAYGAVVVVLHVSFLKNLFLLLPLLLYMMGMMGMTLAISAFLGRTVQLMLVAPIFTLAQGILCGMLITIPDWASLLVYLSYLLPGRWLMLGGDAMIHNGNPVFVVGQAACALIWLAVGTLAVMASAHRNSKAIQA